MLSKNIAFWRYDRPRLGFNFLFQKFFHWHLAHKTNTHTFLLFGCWQTKLLGEFSHLRFSISADRKHGPTQLFLIKLVQKIRLVFISIFDRHHMPTRAVLFYFSVMSGRDIIKTKLARFVEPTPKFNKLVTQHIGIRRATYLIFLIHIIEHLFLVLFRKV